ncbi:MAG: hypothetical protein M1457_00445 [bacterium]|nr:hypothetical protein [bacterium]
MLVKAALPERPDLYPGMFGRLLIPAGEARRLYIPKNAVHQVGQLTYVWVVAGKGEAARRFVKVGEHERGGLIEILSGLSAGEKVGLTGPEGQKP